MDQKNRNTGGEWTKKNRNIGWEWKKTATLEGNGQKKPQHWRGMDQKNATLEGTATLGGQWNNDNIGQRLATL